MGKVRSVRFFISACWQFFRFRLGQFRELLGVGCELELLLCAFSSSEPHHASINESLQVAKNIPTFRRWMKEVIYASVLRISLAISRAFFWTAPTGDCKAICRQGRFFGEGRIVGNRICQAEPAEPAARRIDVNLLAQTTLGPNALTTKRNNTRIISSELIEGRPCKL